MMSRRPLTFRTVRSLVTTSSGRYLDSSLCSIHRHSRDEQDLSAHGVARVISDCLARTAFMSTRPCKREFNTLRYIRRPSFAVSSFADRAMLDICLAEQMNPAYCCEQKRAFASRESDEAMALKDCVNKETISVTFVDRDRDEKTIQVPIGMSILEAAHEYNIELEGACEGSLACSTCHVIVMDEEYYGKLPEPTDEENDMLDLAFGLTETSRLGCQVIAKLELDGIRLALPAATRNFAVDGFVPKPH